MVCRCESKTTTRHDKLEVVVLYTPTCHSKPEVVVDDDLWFTVFTRRRIYIYRYND